MKRALLAAVVTLLCLNVFAQTPDYESIQLDKKEDYNAEADRAAGIAAQYLLSTPIDRNSEERLLASRYLVRWTTGTPAYTFKLDELVGKISRDTKELVIIYMAAMTKYALDNPADSKDDKKVKLNTVKRVLEYCEAQGISMKGELKKLRSANEKGKLEEYLN